VGSSNGGWEHGPAQTAIDVQAVSVPMVLAIVAPAASIGEPKGFEEKDPRLSPVAVAAEDQVHGMPFVQMVRHVGRMSA
jgi:hypothetical protein